MSKKNIFFEHHIVETYCTKTEILLIWFKFCTIYVLNVREFSSIFHLIFLKFSPFAFQVYKAFNPVEMSQYWV